MNVLLLRNLVHRSASLQSFNDYKLSEGTLGTQLSSVTSEGILLEYETLELRLHPPNVQIDNETYDEVTVITIDSANRPGTLIEVVQCLTELGLSIKRARISSDGGWFVDEFFVTETPKGKVVDPRKLSLIKKLLSVDNEVQQGSSSCSVFELAGRDCSGLLARVLQLLVSSGFDVMSAAVWTFHTRVALVVGVTDGGLPIQDLLKLQRLGTLLADMLGGGEEAVVKQEMVRGEIHHERRLHHLLLLEELRSWEQQLLLGAQQLHLEEVASGGLTSPDPSAMGAGGAGGADSRPLSPSCLPPSNRSLSSSSLGATAGGAAGPASGSETPRGLGFSAAGSSEVQVQLKALESGNNAIWASAAAVVEAAAAAAAAGTAVSMSRLSVGNATASDAAASLNFSRLSTGGGAAVLKATVPGLTPMAPAPTASLSSDLLNMSSSWDPNQPLLTGKSFSRAEVKIQHSPLLNYWLVTITSKDRNKLFFDTVCTLADMNYDVYHGTIDSEGEYASQLFYVRPRYGEAIWDADRAYKLKYMLESAVQRRFPRGLKMHVQANDKNCLLDLFSQLSNAGFWITRAEVRTHQDNAVYNFSLTDNTGQIPQPSTLQRTCEQAGGVLVEDLDLMGQANVVSGSSANTPSLYAQHTSRMATSTPQRISVPSNCRFAFSFLERKHGVSTTAHKLDVGRTSSSVPALPSN